MNPHQKIILLIEDEPFIKDLYTLTLNHAGYTVMSAGDGISALDLVKEKLSQNLPFDLILLDIMLPRLNGMEVLKKLKADPTMAHIPVILLTNLGSEEIVKQAFEIGADGYMMKAKVSPYDITENLKKFFENPGYRMDLSGIDFD